LWSERQQVRLLIEPDVEPVPGFAWTAGPIDAHTDADGSVLKFMPDGGTLTVRHGRLRRGDHYADTPTPDRQFLARVGAIVRLRSRGRFHLHAAAVADPAGRAWILAGGNGAGKSTLAYALVRAGWHLMGDDGVIIERTSTGVIAHAWREPLAVSRALAPEFPELTGIAPPPGFHDERDRVPMRFGVRQRAPIAALVFLQRGDHDRIEPMPAEEALLLLVRQSTWVLMPDGHSAAHLDALRALVSGAPAFRLTHTPRQLHAIAATLSGALA
jgi:hypothetical protein